MTVLWTASTLTEALELNDTPSVAFESNTISIDTRTLKNDDIFIALKGINGNGHQYVESAFAKGAAAVIIDCEISGSKPCFVVNDTLNALQKLAIYARKQAVAKVVAITGSVGKTTTKELLRQVLEKFGKTTYSIASYNNHWGVPLSLANLISDSNFGVFEIGMNNEGEISPLASLIKPDVVIITKIAEAHIGHLGSVEVIAKEKAEAFKSVQENGVAILNRDDVFYDYLSDLAIKAGVKNIISFGKHEQATVRLLDYSTENQVYSSLITAQIGDQILKYPLSFAGEHLALNSLAILACCKHFGLDLTLATQALSSLSAVSGRGLRHELTIDGKPITLIDDAYNANPTSMKAGLSSLKNIQTTGRRIAVLGEMAELGINSKQYHQDLAEVIKTSKIDLVFASGEGMTHLYEALPSHVQGACELTAQNLLSHVINSLAANDTVFIKGSKSSKISTIANYLLNTSNPQPLKARA